MHLFSAGGNRSWRLSPGKRDSPMLPRMRDNHCISAGVNCDKTVDVQSQFVHWPLTFRPQTAHRSCVPLD